MAARAATALQRPGYAGEANTVKEYIRESSLAPNAYLTQDCPSSEGGAVPCEPGIMPPNFGERLTAQQLEVLVTYLASQATP